MPDFSLAKLISFHHVRLAVLANALREGARAMHTVYFSTCARQGVVVVDLLITEGLAVQQDHTAE